MARTSPTAPSRARAAAALAAALVIAVCLSAAPAVAATGAGGARRRALQQADSSPAATQQHAFDFTRELVHDAGTAVVPWGLSGSAASAASLSYQGLHLNGSRSAGVTITPDAPVQGAMTVRLTGSYSSDGVIRTAFNLSTVSRSASPRSPPPSATAFPCATSRTWPTPTAPPCAARSRSRAAWGHRCLGGDAQAHQVLQRHPGSRSFRAFGI
jgi:hypothetical protein